MFEQEKAFCAAHRDALREQYPGKLLIIAGDKVIGSYDDAGDTYEDAVKASEPGHFMIQEVPARRPSNTHQGNIGHWGAKSIITPYIAQMLMAAPYFGTGIYILRQEAEPGGVIQRIRDCIFVFSRWQ
jgi:hypothetical protein